MSNGGCGRHQTNADHIRSMSDEGLSAWLANLETQCYKRVYPLMYCDIENFAKQILDWLKSPVEIANGRWDDDGTCSVCGHCDWDNVECKYFRYCPNCGARMEVNE